MDSIIWNSNDEDKVLMAQISKIIAASCFTIYFLVVTINARRNIRRTYSIPGDACEDCFLSTFCSCCVGELYEKEDFTNDTIDAVSVRVDLICFVFFIVSQMARHTGEYEKYPGVCCSSTGLPDTAPMLIV